LNTPARPLALKSATFADHEPVYSDLPGQIPGVTGPTFGRPDMWPGDNVRRPANTVKAAWRCDFPGDPTGNLLIREVAFCMLHPTHSALQEAGIFLPPGKWGLRRTAQSCFDLARLRTWAQEQDMPDDFGLWDPADWQAFIDSRSRVTEPSSVRKVVSSVRHLMIFSPVLTGVPTLEDPWPGNSSAQVAESVWTDELSTPAIPPEVWWPLLRAAWAYIDSFAPDILAERDRRQAEPVSGPPPQMDSDRELEAWLANPGTSIPLNPRNRGQARRGEVNWRRASKLATNGHTPVLFAAEKPHGLKRRRRVLEWLAETGRSHIGPVREPSFTPPAEKQLTHRDRVLLEWLDSPDNLIPVHPADDQVAWAGEPNWTELARLVYGRHINVFALGSKDKAMLRRQWVCEVARDPNRTIATDHGLNPRMLRAACYVFVAALTAMRDSEIHEIERGALAQYYGAPALASRKVKGDDSRPRGYWWIIAPVAQAIAVAEQLTWHDTRVFTAVTAGLAQGGDGGFDAARDIDDFIATVNANREHTGLEEIPEALVRPHMFRHTMSIIAAQEPDGEIALGLQLKHAARRAMANRTTLAYGKPDARWAKEFDNQLQVAAAKKLVSLLQARRAGKVIAVGPGAARFHAGLDKVNDVIEQSTVLRAQLADERLEITLLRDEFADLHLGTVNHCLWNAPTAECQNQLPPEQRGQTPLLGACQPARCRNSVLTLAHERIWRMEEADLVSLLKKKLSKPLREQALTRLAEVRSATMQFDKMRENA
jgi:hypothetical protein